MLANVRGLWQSVVRAASSQINKKGNKVKARKSDPVTSHEAAASVKDLPIIKQTILKILRWPVTDEEMIVAYNSMVLQGKVPASSDSAMRTRRAHLVRDGLVHEVGYGKTRFGRRTIIWQVKK